MVRKLLPILLVLIAFIGGAVAGDMLNAPKADAAETDGGEAAVGTADAPAAEETHAKAPAEEAASGHAPAPAPSGHDSGGGHGESKSTGTGAFKFPKQFFVPVLHDGQLDSTMILSLSLEMPEAERENVNANELKLRDGLLRQLLIRANTGGFDGNFTAEPQLRELKAELLATAQGIVPAISGILIEDIARQER